MLGPRRRRTREKRTGRRYPSVGKLPINYGRRSRGRAELPPVKKENHYGPVDGAARGGVLTCRGRLRRPPPHHHLLAPPPGDNRPADSEAIHRLPWWIKHNVLHCAALYTHTYTHTLHDYPVTHCTRRILLKLFIVSRPAELYSRVHNGVPWVEHNKLISIQL